MNAQQRWIRRQIFRVAAEGRELDADSEESKASLKLKMWDAFHEAKDGGAVKKGRKTRNRVLQSAPGAPISRLLVDGAAGPTGSGRIQMVRLTRRQMTTSELLKCLTPAEQGIIAVCLDDVAHLGDDDAFEGLSASLHLNADLDLDWAAAQRLAYNIVHHCKRA